MIFYLVSGFLASLLLSTAALAISEVIVNYNTVKKTRLHVFIE